MEEEEERLLISRIATEGIGEGRARPRAIVQFTPYHRGDMEREAFVEAQRVSVEREREGWIAAGALSVSLASETRRRRAREGGFVPPRRVGPQPRGGYLSLPEELHEYIEDNLSERARGRLSTVSKAHLARARSRTMKELPFEEPPRELVDEYARVRSRYDMGRYTASFEVYQEDSVIVKKVSSWVQAQITRLLAILDPRLRFYTADEGSLVVKWQDWRVIYSNIFQSLEVVLALVGGDPLFPPPLSLQPLCMEVISRVAAMIGLPVSITSHDEPKSAKNPTELYRKIYESPYVP